MGIYLLECFRKSTDEATTDFLPADPVNDSAAPQCEACGGFIGMRHWEPPFRVELETWGIRFGDMAFGVGDSFLVSARFKALWEKSQLVGLHGLEPVEIVKLRHRAGRIRTLQPAYFRVWVHRSEVAVDAVRSGIRWMNPPKCKVCRLGTSEGRERIVLQGEPTENVLIARGLPGVVLVDERFKSLCEEHAISNCHLTPGEQARRYYY